jgi:hypothetical protein
MVTLSGALWTRERAPSQRPLSGRTSVASLCRAALCAPCGARDAHAQRSAHALCANSRTIKAFRHYTAFRV